MEAVIGIFSVKTTFFTLWDYPMSYLEFVGTILNLWSVWLASRNSVLTWPVGNVAVVLFGALFFQIQLYSDFVEQGYFLVTGFYGWWLWRASRKSGGVRRDAVGLTIIRNSTRANLLCAGIVVLGTIVMGYGIAHIHEYLPSIFSEPASYPYLDAFTTVMSFAANFLLAQRRFECWFLWIFVDIIGIGLYFAKAVIFVSLLYCIFLVLATKGLVGWRRLLQRSATQA